MSKKSVLSDICLAKSYCYYLSSYHILGGIAYSVRQYPIAVRLRTRKGCAVLCVALNPQSGNSSGTTLGVRSVALLHPRSYVRSMQPILQFARKYLAKIGLHLVIRYPTLRFQASLSEWWIMDEIDESIIFMNICLLRLRMCIFCRTFAGWKENHYGRRYQTNSYLQRR